MRVILSICGYGSVVIGVINLLFMGPIWGICKYSYVECRSLDSYANVDFVYLSSPEKLKENLARFDKKNILVLIIQGFFYQQKNF